MASAPKKHDAPEDGALVFRTLCPRCGSAVFFYSNESGGRVFFDSLGPPWPKHGCFDVDQDITPAEVDRVYREWIAQPDDSARNISIELRHEMMTALKRIKMYGDLDRATELVNSHKSNPSRKAMILWFCKFAGLNWSMGKEKNFRFYRIRPKKGKISLQDIDVYEAGIQIGLRRTEI